MSKTIEIQEVILWIERHASPSSALEALEGWLESKLWEPKIGEVCEFSDCENFPDSDTTVQYFIESVGVLHHVSCTKNLHHDGAYRYVRPIKGGGE
jgi:hypothetical protein